jgi:type IV secretion system protein VirB10
VRILTFAGAISLGGFAQQAVATQSSTTPQTLKQRTDGPSGSIQIAPGTHILLNMINSVSTKQANVGDRMYLETAFPVLSGGRIVIPQGSWVTGTITQVKRPGRIKGRGELQVSFDSITLPNGVTRSLHSDLGALDARSEEKLNRERSKVTGPGNKKGDTETVAGTATTGTIIGSGVGAAAGNIGRGAGVGAGAGAAAGLLGVLLSRGPDAMLTKGSTVEMVLDRPLSYTDADLNFNNAPAHDTLSDGASPAPQGTTRGWTPHLP